MSKGFGIIAGIDAMITSVMAALRFHINDYCELATTEGKYNLVGVDGSIGSVIEYEGFMSLINESEYLEFLEILSTGLSVYFDKRAHSMQVVFSTDDKSDELIRTIQNPSYETARRLQLNGMDEILDDSRMAMVSSTAAEKCYIVLWTAKGALAPLEAQIEQKRLKDLGNGKVPPLREAQNPLITSKQLKDLHNAFVQSILVRFQQGGALTTLVDVHTIIGNQKRNLYREKIGPTWIPILPGDSYLTRWKQNNSNDFSVFLPPPLDAQIMLGEGEIGSNKSDIDFTDTRAAKLGDNVFAPAYFIIMPLEPRYFNDLFASMNRVFTTNSSGKTTKMPWAISFHVTGDGMSTGGFTRLFSSILGPLSQGNQDLAAAYNKLEDYSKLGGCVVKYQISAVTWAPSKEQDELAIRRSRLIATLSGWGNASVSDETGDPLLGLVSTIPGLSPYSDAPATAAPLGDVLKMLPFSRPSSVFSGGHCPYRTLDGKVMRWEMFSSHQSAWITLIWAIMGSGKSVWLNRNNIEMCLMPGLKQLPYICAVDIGVSSKGFIDLIHYSLPANLRHLAIYERIQNAPEYAVNQMDTKLGCRKPLPHERAYVLSWLLELVTPPGKLPHHFMGDLIVRLVDRAYQKFSDKVDGSSPKEYGHGADKRVSDAVEACGIIHNSQTTWFEIVDKLALEHGLFVEAEIAQRYASPTIQDLMPLLTESDIKTEFGGAVDNQMNVIDEFKIRASTALSNFKVFNGYTRFDVGSARVMAIDLQDMVTTGSPEAQKAASLYFAMARTCFIKKINLSEEDLKQVQPEYRSYYEKIFKNNQEIPKRISYDEYHKTGGSENLRKIIDADGREGRKWLLEVMLASQKPDDFGSLAELATVKIILNAGNAGSQANIKTIYGLSDTELSSLKEYVHGPTPRGATFLAKVATKTGDKTQLYTSQLGSITMWALTTTAEDRALRSALYKRIPNPINALKMLKIHYPEGSCKASVDALKSNEDALRRVLGSSEVDEDNPFADVLAKKIYQDYMHRLSMGEFEVSTNTMAYA